MDVARGFSAPRPTPSRQERADRRRPRWFSPQRRDQWGDRAAPAGGGALVPGGDLGDLGGADDLVPVHPDDILDPHVHGMGLHQATYEQLRASTDSLVRLLRIVHTAAL